ncbi:MAG: flagellar motor switch protein FliM [bacterium]|nr:flagellar motor switch protein FliM [bacterium]
MVEILSQDEIDALLSAIETGDLKTDEIKEETKHRKIKIYDFKRPDKFSKDQVRSLTNIHETFSRLATNYLSSQMRSIINIDVVSVDQITYEEFIRSINNPTVLAIFNLGGDLEATAVLEINLGLCLTVIDRLFGGLGKTLEKIRPLTEIEETVMKRIVSRLLGLLKEAWTQVVNLSPSLEIIESNPQFIQIVPPNDMVLLVTFEVKIAEAEGIMNLCIPYIGVEPIVSKLSASYWWSSGKKSRKPGELDVIKDQIKLTETKFVVELGDSQATVEEVLNLTVGDVITLKTRINDQLKVHVGGRYKFLARPGKLGKRLAVKITKALNMEEAAEL